MPKVTMPKDHPSAALIVEGQRVERGKSVDVSDETAAGLADQGWTVATKTSAAKKSAAKTEAPEGADPKES